MNARVNYTATPDLTFEFYGQPFVSTGTYSDVREVSATPARDRVRRPVPALRAAERITDLVQIHAAAHQCGRALGISSGLHGIPGVGSTGAQDASNQNPNQSWTRDYRDLFGLHPDNTFLIKVAYWLNR